MKKYSGVYFLFLSCVILAEFSSFTTVKASIQGPFAAIAVDRETKYMLPQEALQNFQEQKFTILYEDVDTFASMPNGSVLFPQDASLKNQYDELKKMCIQDPDFVVLCRKVHLMLLLELYTYLMKLFVTVNMHHPGSVQNKDQISIHIREYVQVERAQALTKKTLFLSMLMEMLEMQFNGIVRSLLPGIAQYQATIVGKTLIQADYGIDLSTLLVNDVQADVLRYRGGLKKYFDFFASYTKYIESIDQRTGKNAFVDVAEHAAKQLSGKNDLFFAQPEALHFVQTSFQKIKDVVHTQPFGWPDFIVRQAQSGATGSTMSGVQYPLAYFTDLKKNRVHDLGQAKRLFIVIAQKDTLFEQELLPEPKWMHSVKGMQEVIQGCFGNGVALVRKGILDPWTEAMIHQIYAVS
jgi:hypothetical protein